MMIVHIFNRNEAIYQRGDNIKMNRFKLSSIYQSKIKEKLNNTMQIYLLVLLLVQRRVLRCRDISCRIGQIFGVVEIVRWVHIIFLCKRKIFRIFHDSLKFAQSLRYLSKIIFYLHSFNFLI